MVSTDFNISAQAIANANQGSVKCMQLLVLVQSAFFSWTDEIEFTRSQVNSASFFLTSTGYLTSGIKFGMFSLVLWCGEI